MNKVNNSKKQTMGSFEINCSAFNPLLSLVNYWLEKFTNEQKYCTWKHFYEKREAPITCCTWISPRSSHTSDLKIGTPVATLPGAWQYRVSAGTGWSSVSILWLSEMESLICNFYLSLAERQTVWADLSLRYTSICWDVKQPTNNNNPLPVRGVIFWGVCLHFRTPGLWQTLRCFHRSQSRGFSYIGVQRRLQSHIKHGRKSSTQTRDVGKEQCAEYGKEKKQMNWMTGTGKSWKIVIHMCTFIPVGSVFMCVCVCVCLCLCLCSCLSVYVFVRVYVFQRSRETVQRNICRLKYQYTA